MGTGGCWVQEAGWAEVAGWAIWQARAEVAGQGTKGAATQINNRRRGGN